MGSALGGTGIKGAPVDLDTGQLAAERVRLPTPQPAVPAAVAGLVGQIITAFGWRGPVGITFPGVVVDGVVRTAANVDGSWLDTDARSLFGAATGAGTQAVVLNDADAAGMGEMRFGAGARHTGDARLLTLGTGIGSALFPRGGMWPDTPRRHPHLHGRRGQP